SRSGGSGDTLINVTDAADGKFCLQLASFFAGESGNPQAGRNDTDPRPVPAADIALLACARVSGKRVGGFQVLNDGTEVYRLGIERLVFGDFCPIQNLEPVALEYFFATPAFERDDLATDAFLAGAIKVTQIGTHQRARCRNLSRVRQQIDMKMR